MGCPYIPGREQQSSIRNAIIIIPCDIAVAELPLAIWHNSSHKFLFCFSALFSKTPRFEYHDIVAMPFDTGARKAQHSSRQSTFPMLNRSRTTSDKVFTPSTQPLFLHQVYCSVCWCRCWFCCKVWWNWKQRKEMECENVLWVKPVWKIYFLFHCTRKFFEIFPILGSLNKICYNFPHGIFSFYCYGYYFLWMDNRAPWWSH